MFIGTFNNKSCTIGAGSPNKSVCVTGISGSGKTCRLNQIELKNAKKCATVVILDMNHTHDEEQIFSPIRQEYLNICNRIHAVKDGLDLCIFQPLKNTKNEIEPSIHLVNSVVQALSVSQNMGVRQIATLREVVIDAIKYRSDFASDTEALDFCLSIREDSYAEAIRQKLWTLLNCGILRPSPKYIKSGAINILDFSEVDALTQASLSELTLSSIGETHSMEV